MNINDPFDAEVLEIMRFLNISLNEKNKSGTPDSLIGADAMIRSFLPHSRRDELNACSMTKAEQAKGEFLRIFEQYAETQDPALREAYLQAMRQLKRDVSLEYVDILSDWIARIEKARREYKPHWWRYCQMLYRSQGSLWWAQRESPEPEADIRRELEVNGCIVDLWEIPPPPPKDHADRKACDSEPVEWLVHAVNRLTAAPMERRVFRVNLMKAYRQLECEGFRSGFQAKFVQHDGALSAPIFLFKVVRLSQRTGKTSDRFEFARTQEQAVAAWVWRGMDLCTVSRV